MTPLEMLINAVIQATTDIITRHHAETGEILTDEGVKAKLDAEITGGKNIITNWFTDKGRTPPS